MVSSRVSGVKEAMHIRTLKPSLNRVGARSPKNLEQFIEVAYVQKHVTSIWSTDEADRIAGQSCVKPLKLLCNCVVQSLIFSIIYTGNPMQMSLNKTE